MDLDLLARGGVGQLVPIEGQDARHGDFEYFAYLADPLPGDVEGLASATWTSVVRASSALAQLNQACLQLPDPRLLIRPTLWREALDTSALEGTVGGLQELLESRLPSAQYLSPETREIRAYERVALEAFSLIHEREISVGLLSDLQAELFRDADHPPREPGRIRQDQVWIGPRDRPIQESRFVPAPGDDRLVAGMREWERWVRADHDHLPPVLRAALAHYQFETLHPFGDGNGRIGRLVIVLQLLRGGALQHPAITISPWFLKRRAEYQQALFNVSASGDWNPWLQFFCRAVCEQCALLIPAADQLVAWLADNRRMVHERRWTGAIHRLLEDLIEWPVTTVADTAARYEVTTMNATRMINHLVEIDVLKEITGRSYNRVFGATFVMRTVDTI
jgi:Fic family protein